MKIRFLVKLQPSYQEMSRTCPKKTPYLEQRCRKGLYSHPTSRGCGCFIPAGTCRACFHLHTGRPLPEEQPGSLPGPSALLATGNMRRKGTWSCVRVPVLPPKPIRPARQPPGPSALLPGFLHPPSIRPPRAVSVFIYFSDVRVY